MILSLSLTCIFFLLSAIHFNWVFGGTFGFDVSIPTKETGERVLNPKKIDSAIVALGLLAFGLFYLLNSNLINYELPSWIIRYASWMIPVIFLLRALGDFKYVGFFKKVRSTPFGKFDTKFFSPLCLVIGFLGILITLI